MVEETGIPHIFDVPCKCMYPLQSSEKKKVSLSQFIKDLCQDLPVCEEEPLRPCMSGSRLSRLENGKHFLERMPPCEGKKRLQRMCKICSEKGRKQTVKAVRKDTSYQCSDSNV